MRYTYIQFNPVRPSDSIWCQRSGSSMVQAMACRLFHYNDVKMSVMASQITSLAIVYSTVYSGTDERKHQRTASLAFVRGIQQWPVNSPHKSSVTQKKFLFDHVIMSALYCYLNDYRLIISWTYRRHIWMKSLSKFGHFRFREFNWKCRRPFMLRDV